MSIPHNEKGILREVNHRLLILGALIIALGFFTLQMLYYGILDNNKFDVFIASIDGFSLALNLRTIQRHWKFRNEILDLFKPIAR